jgi:hypothetical protein
MRDIRIILIFLALIITASCSPDKVDKEAEILAPGVRVVKEHYPDGRLKSQTEALGKLRHGKSKEYRKDGTLESFITYENNRKHGPAHTYYPDGKTVKTEVNYRYGFKHGDANWYFPDGEIYRITPYFEGKINGIRTTFYEDGTKQAEVPYLTGQPGLGLKEYHPDGNMKVFNAGIVFSERDRTSLDNTFRLTISVSDGGRNVEYFSGKLTEGKFWNEKLAPIQSERGVGVIDYHISKGNFKMETINVVARVKTSLKNYHIIQREYHLAVENKY